MKVISVGCEHEQHAASRILINGLIFRQLVVWLIVNLLSCSVVVYY